MPGSVIMMDERPNYLILYYPARILSQKWNYRWEKHAFALLLTLRTQEQGMPAFHYIDGQVNW